MILDATHTSPLRVSVPALHFDFLRVLRSSMKLFALFRPFLEKAGQIQQLATILSGDPVPLLFIPAFELNRKWQQLTKILVDGGVAEERSTLFAWEHLMDRIDRCSVLISASRVEIAPVVAPISSSASIGRLPESHLHDGNLALGSRIRQNLWPWNPSRNPPRREIWRGTTITGFCSWRH